MFNNMTVLQGSASTAGTSGVMTFQVGAGSNQVITMDLISMTASALGVSAMSITTQSGANSAIVAVDDAIALVDDFRSDMGAKINRFTYAIDNLTNVSVNTAASRSRILDADYAKASSELSRTQIIQQAATAILAQANTDQQSVMKLLQG
jgi:flagellin